MISVIIAMYNAEDVIKACLKSIYSSVYDNFEVIVIDDCSTDNSANIVMKFPCKYIKLEQNSGPAKARNEGVKNSKGEILFFVDSDTEMNENTLLLLENTFKEKPDIFGVIGVPRTRSLRKGKAPDYNALENYFQLAKSKEKYVNYFTTQMGAIKRSIFDEVGGFDTRFKSADIEDIEFGSRLPENKVYINDKLVVGHHFPNFKSIIKKYFKRSYMMTKFIKKKKGKKFGKAHITISRFLSILFALMSFFSLILLIFDLRAIYLSLILFFIFLIFSSKLLLFILKERGIGFMAISIFYKYVFSLAIGLGGVYALIKRKNESNTII